MPITNHTGLPRAGKSYDTVVYDMLGAAKDGYRIVTSVTGVNAAAMEAIARRPVQVRFITTEEVQDPRSYPSFDEQGNLLEEGLVIRARDFIVLDEIFRYWGDSNRVADQLDKRVQMFLRYHGKIECVIHLITQHPDDVPPFIRRVVDVTKDVVSMRNLGFKWRYRVNVYSRDRIEKDAKIDSNIRKLQPRNFHLYKSFSHEGGGAVKAAAVSKKFVIALCLVIVAPIAALVVALTSLSGDGPVKREKTTVGGPRASDGSALPAGSPSAVASNGGRGVQAQKSSGTSVPMQMPPMDSTAGAMQQTGPAGAYGQAMAQTPNSTTTVVPPAMSPVADVQGVVGQQQAAPVPRRHYGRIEIEPFKGQLSNRPWRCPTSGTDLDNPKADPRC